MNTNPHRNGLNKVFTEEWRLLYNLRQTGIGCLKSTCGYDTQVSTNSRPYSISFERMVFIPPGQFQRIYVKAHWSCSGSSWWPNTLLKHMMLVSFNLSAVCTYDLHIPQCDKRVGDWSQACDEGQRSDWFLPVITPFSLTPLSTSLHIHPVLLMFDRRCH